MITKIDHIGIAVKSIEATMPYYEKILGLKCEGQEEVASQKVKTAFFLAGDVHVELLEPTSPDSPIAQFIEKRGEGIHHIAFASDDLTNQLKQAKDNGCRLINETPVTGAHDKQIAFLHPKSTFGVLTEICGDGKE